MIDRKEEDVRKVTYAEKDHDFQVAWFHQKAQKDHYRLDYASATQLDVHALEKLVNLTEANMKQLYQTAGSSWGGWRRKYKKDELSSTSSRLVMVADEKNKEDIKAFAHFQFTFESSMKETHEIPVLYWCV
jgi:hypothetical protein